MTDLVFDMSENIVGIGKNAGHQDLLLFSVSKSLLPKGCSHFPKQQFLDSSKLKEFADNKFKFDGNGRKFSKRVENIVMSNFSFSHSVFKRLVL